MYVDPLSDLNLHVVITQVTMPQCFMPKTWVLGWLIRPTKYVSSKNGLVSLN